MKKCGLLLFLIGAASAVYSLITEDSAAYQLAVLNGERTGTEMDLLLFCAAAVLFLGIHLYVSGLGMQKQ